LKHFCDESFEKAKLFVLGVPFQGHLLTKLALGLVFCRCSEVQMKVGAGTQMWEKCWMQGQTAESNTSGGGAVQFTGRKTRKITS